MYIINTVKKNMANYNDISEKDKSDDYKDYENKYEYNYTSDKNDNS